MKSRIKELKKSIANLEELAEELAQEMRDNGFEPRRVAAILNLHKKELAELTKKD